MTLERWRESDVDAIEIAYAYDGEGYLHAVEQRERKYATAECLEYDTSDPNTPFGVDITYTYNAFTGTLCDLPPTSPKSSTPAPTTPTETSSPRPPPSTTSSATPAAPPKGRPTCRTTSTGGMIRKSEPGSTKTSSALKEVTQAYTATAGMIR